MKYIYCFSGGFFALKKDKDGKLHESDDYYLIDVDIPINYETEEDAEACSASLRFQKIGGHIYLVIWSDWKQGYDKNGKWKEHVAGEVVDIISWNERWKYRVLKIKEDRKNDAFTSSEDYLPDATPWDELFENDSLPEGWVSTVESLAYAVIEKS